jgi:hypothetical protein
MKSVSCETNKAFSKPITSSVPSGRTDAVFSKTNFSRNKVSTPVEVSASQGETKKIAFSKARSLAFKAKNNGGKVSALNRIKASNSEAKKTTSFDAQLALDGEAINAQLALNGEAIQEVQLALNGEAIQDVQLA